jgi:hypothetical protein
MTRMLNGPGAPRKASDGAGDVHGDRGAADLERALTELAWSDPGVEDDPAAALARLGVEVPAGLRIEVRVQRPDTLYLVIPPALPEGGGGEDVVNQIDLWRSGDQFVWIMPQDAKMALLKMREQYRNGGGEGAR